MPDPKDDVTPAEAAPDAQSPQREAVDPAYARHFPSPAHQPLKSPDPLTVADLQGLDGESAG